MPVSVKDLVNCPFILTEKGMSYRRILEERLAELSLEISPVLEIGNPDSICRLVEQGTEISFLPDYVTDRLAAEGRLIRLPVEEVSVQVWKQLIHHRDKWVSPALESVLAYCEEREFAREDSSS